MLTGGCLCGSVRFEIDEAQTEFRACHCSSCRKMSGHYWSAFHVASDKFRFTEQRGLKWYNSSDWAERGFCKECGSSMFFRMNDKDGLEVAPGSIDGKTGARIVGHIYVGERGDYYDLTDGLPTWEEY